MFFLLWLRHSLIYFLGGTPNNMVEAMAQRMERQARKIETLAQQNAEFRRMLKVQQKNFDNQSDRVERLMLKEFLATGEPNPSTIYLINFLTDMFSKAHKQWFREGIPDEN